jgi:uncharacterized OsmC-like protein
MPKSTFKVVSRKLPGGFAVESESRGFKIIMDEPAQFRGTDTGMNPVEALLAALGSCQCMTAVEFAKSQDIDLKEFWVELEGDIGIDGCRRGDPNVRPGYQEVRFTMHIKTDAPQDKVEAFQQFIENHCSVGDSLAKGVSMMPTTIVIEK